MKKNKIFISLHVSVTIGTNISAVTGSLKHRVRYAVEQATGMDVAGINVFVDSITE
ncbi:MAG: Asp23/Gls24 family envelope stress response protein [Oscillospiraceae bacterium]|nr:Asp23/Gls24 family envelope stress response protein [Oscillospiraceae bacterium]